MITKAVQQKSKYIEWTDEASDGFELLKSAINACPLLYYIDYNLPIILCTDASNYAIGGYLYQISKDNLEQPIRFLSKTLSGAQLRWSTIEKEAFAIYFSLLKMEDLLGGVSFTIKTDHKNLLFLNQAGSNKVLNWKLTIQKFDFNIEYIKGSDNIVADTFSRLVEPEHIPTVTTNVLVSAKCTDAQRQLIEQFHTYQGAHWGATRTQNLIKELIPDKTSKDQWPTLTRDIRDYIQSCPTCQKMSTITKPITADRFILSSAMPMIKIDMDTLRSITHRPPW
jgi:hypothetical protein